jgi:uncharacterized membrane protein YcaP (DUF421 family)
VDIVLRAAFAFVFIQFLMRVVGRRELSSMKPSDLILLVVMGDLIQNGVTQSDYSITGLALAFATMGVLAVATSYLAYRSRRARTVIEGQPLILVEDGKPIEMNMVGERITLDDIAEEARGEGIESIDRVKWAVLETSGKISFIEK